MEKRMGNGVFIVSGDAMDDLITSKPTKNFLFRQFRYLGKVIYDSFPLILIDFKL